MNKVRSAIAVAMLTAVAAPASAAVIGTIPGGTSNNNFVNKFLGVGTEVEGYYGANLYLVGGSSLIDVEFFGAEAGYVNTFNFANCSFTNASGNDFTGSDIGGLSAADRLGSCTTTLQGPGLLNFSFLVNGGPSGPVNGTNPNNSVSPFPNFFVTFDNNFAMDTVVNGHPTGGQSVWLFLDDGGAGDDDNHDDLVIRLSLRNGSFAVPEPTTLGLLGLGLAGIGFAARRRKA